ncbi:unnamed protein product, partial [Symbiodinium sp. CCMP2456]
MAARPKGGQSHGELSGKALTSEIARLGRSGRWQEVLQLATKTLSSEGGLRPNVISMNAALAAFCRSRAWRWSLALLGVLETRGLDPDAVTCGSAIHACGIGNSWPTSMALLRRMKTLNAEPSTTTLNEALNALQFDTPNWQTGLELAERIATEGLRPDVITRGSLASASGHRWAEALNLFRSMGGAAALSTALVGGIISSCTAALRWHRAMESLLHLRQVEAGAGVSGSLVICRGSVLKSLARSFRWELCCAELLEMWRRCRSQEPRSSAEPPPDLWAHNVCISACELSGRWRQALLLLRLARGCRLQLDEISFASAASACTRRGLAWAFGLWLFEELRLGGGPEPDAVFMTATLTACDVGQRWHSAMKLRRTLEMPGLQTDEAMNLPVMSCCQRSAFWTTALQLLEEMPLTYGVGNAAVGACSRAMQWMQSSFLLRFLPDRDVLSFAAFLDPS